MGALKTVFRRIRGRIIPIRIHTTLTLQDDYRNIMEVQRARSYLKNTEGADHMAGIFLKITRERAKKTGEAIAKRLSRFKRKGGIIGGY